MEPGSGMGQIERIAEQAGVDADKVAAWAEIGLLGAGAGPEIGADAVERVRLIDLATRRGIKPEVIARVEASRGDIVGRFVELMGGPRSGGRSLDELAAAVDMDPELVRRFWLSSGLGDQDVLFDEDVEMVESAMVALRSGLPPEALLQMVRVFADALGRVADAESRLFHFYVHEQLRAAGLSGQELLDATNAISDPLLGVMEPTVLYVHRKAWHRAMEEDCLLHLREDAIAAGAPIAELPVTVLFADLASFTPLTEAMGDSAAASVVDRFSDIAREAAAACDGRVVKQIGDEFMLVFSSAAAAVTCGLRIRAKAAGEPQFPAMRMGAHSGTALYREADYLGTTVNMAARVASEARRGEFLVTEAVRQEATDLPEIIVWEPVGARRLKGISEPVELFEIRQPTHEGERAVDPVCGMDLDPGQAVPLDWHGEEILFCSERCRDRFLEAPDRYRLT